jgi:deoxycytidylate deaminase
MKNIFEFSKELFGFYLDPISYNELINDMIIHGQKGLCSKSKRVAALIKPNGLYVTGTNSPPSPFSCKSNEFCKKICNQICIHAEERALLLALKQYSKVEDCICLHLKIVNCEPVVSGNPSCVTCSRKLLECGVKYMYLWQEKGWQQWTTEEFHFETLKNLGLTC